MPFATYDPAKVTLSMGGNNIVGFAPGTFVKCARNEDAYTLSVGADGLGARTRNANRSGTIEITLKADSPSNDLLSAQAALDELSGEGVGAALVKDGTGTTVASAENAWIKKLPDIERAKELGEVTWTFETDLLQLTVGGTTPI